MNQFNPVITKRTPSDTVFAEVFLSPGPQAIGVTGQNRLQDFVGQEWMLLLDKGTREVQLWVENGSWLRVDVPGHPLIGGIAPAGSRRFALCFDQAATPVVAYELDGVIRVTRWDPVQQQYIQNVSFAGVDPSLQFDAVWTGDIPGSDVLLFYLTPDRTGVRARVQRELYAVENTVWDYDAPVILDRVIPAPIRYQVLVSDASGSPLDEVLLSELYPVTLQERLATIGGFGAVVALSLERFFDGYSEAPALASGRFNNIGIVGNTAELLLDGLGANVFGNFGNVALTGERAFYALPADPPIAVSGAFGTMAVTVSRVPIGPVVDLGAQVSGSFGGVIRVQQT